MSSVNKSHDPRTQDAELYLTRFAERFEKGKERVNSKNRALLGRYISVLKENNLPEKYKKIDEAVSQFDTNIESQLKTFNAALRNKRDFYTYKKKGQIEVKRLGPDASRTKKIIFKFNKVLRNDSAAVKDLFLAGNLVASDNKNVKTKLKKSIKYLNQLKKDESFYKNKGGIKNYLNITAALNAAIDASKNPKTDNEIENKLLEGHKKIEAKKSSTSHLIQNLVAITIGVGLKASENESALLKEVGAGPELAMVEQLTLASILKNTDPKFSDEERGKLHQYYSDINRSKDLNAMLRSAENPDDERVIAGKTFDAINKLNDGESLVLDLGYRSQSNKGREWVGVRAEFKKSGQHLIIKMHDPTGGLQKLSKESSKKSSEAKSETGFTTMYMNVPFNKFEKNGREYLQSLFAVNCDREVVKANTMTPQEFKRVFTSISTSYHLKNKMKLEKAEISYAQRLRVMQQDRFGASQNKFESSDLYKKFRTETLKQVYRVLLNKSQERLLESNQERLNAEIPRAKNKSEERRVEKARKANLKEAKKLARKDHKKLKKELGKLPTSISEKELKESRDFLSKLKKPPGSREELYHSFRVLKHELYREGSSVG